MTLNTSQAEQAAANSIFLLILPLSCQAVINGTASGTVNQNFPKRSGVQESRITFKKSKMSKFSPFFLLQNFLNSYAILMWGQESMACNVIHQTKPKCVGIHHAKGLQDWSTYKGDNRHLKRSTNFWTPCSSDIFLKLRQWLCILIQD